MIYDRLRFSTVMLVVHGPVEASLLRLEFATVVLTSISRVVSSAVWRLVRHSTGEACGYYWFVTASACSPIKLLLSEQDRS